MTSPERPQHQEIWDKLSQDAHAVVLWLGPLTATSADRDFLEHMAREPVEELGGHKTNLQRGLNELQQFGILESVTYVDELKETIARFKPTRDILDPLLSHPLTDEEMAYLKAKYDLEWYEGQPKKSGVWDQPRFRLKTDFKQYVAKQWEDRLGFSFEDRK